MEQKNIQLNKFYCLSLAYNPIQEEVPEIFKSANKKHKEDFGHMKDELPNTKNMTHEELCKMVDEYIIDHNTVRKQWHREKMSPVAYREHLLCL